jgi:hypothetical protein
MVLSTGYDVGVRSSYSATANASPKKTTTILAKQILSHLADALQVQRAMHTYLVTHEPGKLYTQARAITHDGRGIECQ